MRKILSLSKVEMYNFENSKNFIEKIESEIKNDT